MGGAMFGYFFCLADAGHLQLVRHECWHRSPSSDRHANRHSYRYGSDHCTLWAVSPFCNSWLTRSLPGAHYFYRPYWIIVSGPCFLLLGSGLLYSVKYPDSKSHYMGYSAIIGVGIGNVLQNTILAVQYVLYAPIFLSYLWVSLTENSLPCLLPVMV